MPKTLPMPPSAGPPPHSPADSKTFVIESTVARTLESSTFAFSHVECTGAASERVESRAPEGREREREGAREREREQPDDPERVEDEQRAGHPGGPLRGEAR